MEDNQVIKEFADLKFSTGSFWWWVWAQPCFISPSGRKAFLGNILQVCLFVCRHSMQVLDEVPMIWGSCFMVYTMQGVLTIASYSFTSTLCLGYFSHRLLFSSLVWFDGRIILGVWSYALLIPLEFPSVLFLHGLHSPIVLILISMSSLGKPRYKKKKR